MHEHSVNLNDLSKLSAEDINNLAKIEGEKYSKSIKISQIRNVYSAITQIRNDFKYRNKNKYSEKIERDLIVLKPKLAYAAGRNDKVMPFQKLFDKAIDGVINSDKKNKALNNFFLLSEAVVAYHKYFGGK